MGEETKELQSYSPHGLISQALAQNLPIATLERLMDLQERWDKNQAKKQFDEAMSKFQSKCPIIKKMKIGGKTKSGAVAYKYAPLEKIVEQTKDLIAECGFSYLIKTPSFANGDVEVTCEVRHVAGHSETSSVKMPLVAKTEIMSQPQVVAGTITFCKRYAFCNAFGIMTMDEDNDGQTSGKPKEEIPEPTKKTDEDPVLKKIKEIKTTAELKKYYSGLSEPNQQKYLAEFSNRKEALIGNTK